MSILSDFRREFIEVDPRIGLRFITVLTIAFVTVTTTWFAIQAAAVFTVWAFGAGFSPLSIALIIGAAYLSVTAVVLLVGHAIVRIADERGFHF